MLAEARPASVPRVDASMTRHPITITSDATVAAAAALLHKCRIRHLPVMDGDDLVGLVSVRDVLPAQSDDRVRAIMKQPVLTIGPDEPVTAACQRMLHHRVSSLAVIGSGGLVGIFTATDLLRLAARLLRSDRPTAPVTHLMTAGPLVTIDARATLVTAWNLMHDARVRHLPVLSGDALVGVLSDRDLLVAGRAWLVEASEGQEQPALLVADAMTTQVITIGPDRPAAEAADALGRRRIGALPVVRGGTLVGVLSVTDFLYWMLSRS